MTEANAEPNYDFGFYADNVYGHALDLLARHHVSGAVGGVHLDIGCGFGRIAEPLVARLGVAYIGVDGSHGGLDSLRQRGFEAHHLLLTDEEETLAALERIIDGRTIASITFLDVIEHLVDGAATLRVISRLARQSSALVVVSTPNFGHADIGFKLAFGRWDYTDSGLLDHTHVRLFDDRLFTATLRQSGLVPFDSYDVEKIASDQAFPMDHPALAAGTLLRGFLSAQRHRIDAFAATYQFVRLCIPGPRVDVATHVSEREIPRPFLTAVVRTRGEDLHRLAETLLCMSGQTDDDFEVIVLGHLVDIGQRYKVERTIEDTPEWLRNRVRLIWVDSGNSAHPLNIGFSSARGRYMTILDDEDLPMANWVETFRGLAKRSPGRVLRAAVMCQEVDDVVTAGGQGLRAEGSFDRTYPADFDLLSHLRDNATPSVSVAFPRGAFHDLGIRFDEALTTDQDWDFLVQSAAVIGVEWTSEVTAVYRSWPGRRRMWDGRSAEERARNRRRILEKFDDLLFLMPKGSLPRSSSSGASGDLEIETDAALLGASLRDAERYRPRRQNIVSRLVSGIWIGLCGAYYRLKYFKKIRKVAGSSFFNRHWYACVHPDVVRSGFDPVVHYVVRGGREGLDPGPCFDAGSYLLDNPDLAAGHANPLIHYIDFGCREGRRIRRSRRGHPADEATGVPSSGRLR